MIEPDPSDGGSHLTLDRYQELAAATDLEGSSDNKIMPLLGLGGEIGALTAEFKKKIRPDGHSYVDFDNVVRVELGDILWYLAALARRIDTPLSQIAHQNLVKTRGRWIASDGPPEVAFDVGVPEDQRIPRQFDAVFTTETDGNGLVTCNLRFESEELGDPIDDNSRHEDHYRYHDVFHIAHAAVLGWSPVLRLLIRRKRGYDPDTDRVEDGARAIATEEAVTAMVFELAKAWGYFDGAANVDDGILNAVQAVTARLEGGSLPGAQWERAILAGYAVWRELRENQGGRVLVDLDTASIRYALA
jgi:MazG C-terminal domain